MLVLTYKGLTEEEIQSIAGVNVDDLQIFLIIFKAICFKFKSFWKITNISILKYFQKNILRDKALAKALHCEIIAEMKTKPLSLRVLEELTINLFLAKEFFHLKQTLCLVDNFLLLFNENTKMLLHEFWKVLEMKGYDLVQEYNKSLEIFDIHFMPSDEDIFLVNIQLCQFFKGNWLFFLLTRNIFFIIFFIIFFLTKF